MPTFRAHHWSGQNGFFGHPFRSNRQKAQYQWLKYAVRQLVLCQESSLTSPSHPREVAEWARQRFYEETAKAEEHITLAKACMLIALEDEAAVIVDEQESRARTTKIVESFVKGSLDNSQHFPPRDIGSASTWSLERLDALAAEAKALFKARCSMGSAPVRPRDPPPPLDPKPRRKGSAAQSDSSLSGSSSSRRTHHPVDGMSDETASARRQQTGTEGELMGAGSAQPSSSQGVNRQTTSRRSRGQKQGRAKEETTGLEAEPSSSRECQIGSGQTAQQLVPARQARSPVCDYPVQALAAVNSVLFERHGYRRMYRHGDPRDSQLSAVLERGTGGSAALAILYMEVCERMGLRMAARPLEDGRYFVLWPAEAPLRSCGQRFVVDSYSDGALFLLDEICQVFEHSGPSDELLMNPASKREILAALLATLRDTHWAAAVGCHPEPGLMVPISLSTALGATGTIAQVAGINMERTIAAAERRAYLLPQCRSTQLELCLLYYFAGHHDDAWEELQMMQADQPESEASQEEALLPLFMQKLKLCRSLESSEA